MSPMSQQQRSRWILFFVALLLGTALDLATKEIAFAKLPNYGDSHAIYSWFAFTHAKNEGAAFGLFQGQHTFFMVVTIGAFVAVPYFVHTADRRVKITAIVLGLILAGVVGNFWDRMVYGYVRDFLDVHTPPEGAIRDFFANTVPGGRTVWPTFNVADMFITTGALTIVLVLGREAKKEGDEKPKEPDEKPPAEVGVAEAAEEAGAEAEKEAEKEAEEKEAEPEEEKKDPEHEHEHERETSEKT